MASRNPYRLDGKTFDLTVEDVAPIAGRTTRWVYFHAERLGGEKRAWLADSTGNQRKTIRFNRATVIRALKTMAIAPNSGRAAA